MRHTESVGQPRAHALTLSTLRASCAALLGWLAACWELRPWALPGPVNTRIDQTSIDQGAIRANTVLGRLERLAPAETLEKLVLQLEEHERDARAGEILARFQCDRTGHCVEGRVLPAEFVSRRPSRPPTRSPLTAARP